MALTQLWLWFIGMEILTTPWHVMGLQGQPRRISSTPYDTPLVDAWVVSKVLMVIGGSVLLLSALLLIWNLSRTHQNLEREAHPQIEYAEPVYPVLTLPKPLNGFALGNWIILIYIVASYGYPIAQFFMLETYGAFPWSI